MGNFVVAVRAAIVITLLRVQVDASIARLAGPAPEGYQLESDAINEASIAEDLIRMYETSNITEKLQFYENGHGDGEITLKSLGTNALQFSVSDPLFDIYVAGFEDIGSTFEGTKNGMFDENPSNQYAHSIFSDLVDLEEEFQEIPDGIEVEAILVTGLWMRIHHHLHNILNICGTDEPDSRLMLSNLDKAAALWIGNNQVFGSNTVGVMLYNLAERTAVEFGQDSGESIINREFLTKLKEVKVTIKNDECHFTPDGINIGYDVIHTHLKGIRKQMNVLLVQRLIHFMSTKVGIKFTMLYGLTLAPQIWACSPADYTYFMKDVVLKTDFDSDSLEISMARLQNMYSCLGVTCVDIGAYNGHRVPQCMDIEAEPIRPLAGYIPLSDVRRYTKVDRDIRQIEIHLDKGNIDAAKDLYRKGCNMFVGNDSPISLHNLASELFDTLEASNDNARMHKMFEKYYGNDPAYADKIIWDSFADEMGESQSAISRILQTIVVPHHAIRVFFAAVDTCIDDRTKAAEFFDQGVAVLVGSNEGIEEGGSSDGISWFSLTRRFCSAFNCNDNEQPPLNSRMMDILTVGQNDIINGNCNSLIDNLDKIEPLLLVPIIEGLLYHSAMRQKDPSLIFHYDAAKVFAKAVVPVVKIVSEVQARIIEDNIFNNVEDSINTAEVWEAIGFVVAFGNDDDSELNLGISCEEIGNPNFFLDGRSFCEFVTELHSRPTEAPVPFTDFPTSSTAPTLAPSRKDRNSRIDRGLINGRYSFTDMNDAELQAKIALDLRDILLIDDNNEEELSEAQTIYSEGRHSRPLNILKEFGTRQPSEMRSDAYYNFYRYAWKDERIFQHYSNTNTNVVDLFADAIVRSAIEQAKDTKLAYEVLITVTMSMEIIHLLTAEVQNCKNGTSDGALIDKAFAFYVGVTQTKGNSDGYLLYSLAQKAGILLNTIDHSTGEAKVNNDIILLFNKAKGYTQNCSLENITAFLELRQTIGSIISTMNIPLVQLLEHHLTNADFDQNYVELYSLAVLPQILVCDPTSYDYLVEKIVESELQSDEVNQIRKILMKCYRCFGITCNDVHGNTDNCPDEYTALAGFVPDKNVNKYAVLDQDILKIKALATENAMVPATDYYKYGNPSISKDLFHTSLEYLGSDHAAKESPYYETFKKYYGDNEAWANEIITYALSDNSNLNHVLYNSSLEDRVEIVLTLLQTVVLFSTGLGSMLSSVQTCKSAGTFDAVIEHWDRAAAFLIGSLEGHQRGGDDDDHGVSFYGLAKDLCWDFQSCTGDGTAQLNDELVENFSLGESLVSNRDCDKLEELVNNSMIPILLVPLVQGTLEAVRKKERARAFAMSRSILPIVRLSNVTSAATIFSQTDFINGNLDVALVAEAFAGAIEGGIPIACPLLGTWRKFDYNFCLNEEDSADGTSLSNGLYVTTSNVGDRAKIDLDIADMIKSINNKNPNMAKDFYLNGFNSYYAHSNEPILRSLAKMSLNESMVEEPVFNLYRYALAEKDGKFLGEDVAYYAHSLVMSFFDTKYANTDQRTLPAEAAVALNLWGHIVHKLHESVERCRVGFVAKDDGIHYIDEAVAYWIGSAQFTGDSSRGHLLYRLTEEAGEMFGQGLDGQSRNNRKILQLFTEASRVLSSSNGCNTEVANRFRLVVNRIVAQMTVPLIQHLIASLKKNETGRVKLYSYAVVPLIAGCREGTYRNLKQKLITSTYDTADVDDIISQIYSTFNCLGITCRDVGSYVDGPVCSDRQGLSAFAGYTPKTDVQELLDIDLDIRFIEIMMKMGAENAAMDVYSLGKHVMMKMENIVEPLSLQHLATTKEREISTSFDVFYNYFSDKNYADSAITGVFNEPTVPDKEGKSNGQKTEEVISILRFMITPMAALQKLSEAANQCTNQNTPAFRIAKERWDEGAALLIGSMEGSGNGGSRDGYLIHGLARNLCSTFGVCTSEGDAQVNQMLIEALYAGFFSLSSRSCTMVRHEVEKIESLIKIPLIQASLVTAVENSKLSQYTDAESIASGYIYSRAILPYIENKDVANVIERNLDLQVGVRPVKDGWQKVFLAFEIAVDDMTDVDCREIGYLSTVNTGLCNDDGVTSGCGFHGVQVILFVSTILVAGSFLIGK